MSDPIRLAGKAKTSPSTLHMDGTSPVTVHVQATTDELRALHNQTVEIALPATPAERAVIDAAEWTVDEDAATGDACRSVLTDAVARLRSERNKNDG